MSSSSPPRLITIPISHYCEKARWALDRAGIVYREERHIQLVHRIASRRAGGDGTVPVLVTAEGAFTQSADILAFADRHVAPGARLYPEAAALRDEVVALERDFDADLGPEGRRWMYFHVLPLKDLGVAYNCTGVPAWERRAFPVALSVMSGYIRHLFAIGPTTGDDGRAAVQRTFDAVAARLDDGRPYLCGDAFTAADLAFAALAAPVVMPREYGVPLPAVEELPPDMAAAVRAFRAHPAGAFACRLFAEER
jgi:glutathione S-transferase